MELGTQVQAGIEMLDLFFSSGAPFDIIMAKFFRHNQWIGSHDRRAIAEFSYSIFRNFEKLKFLMGGITSNFGRFYALTFLKTENYFPDRTMEEIFSGRRRSPEKLTDFERKFINSLDKKIDFPEHVRLNYPEWMEPLFKRSFSSDDFTSEMLALGKKAPVDLRVNALKASPDEVKKRLSTLDFKWKTVHIPPTD
jgi:16S rRNA (cytosine967-C5)-methyltransferase